MITQICQSLRNWFDIERYFGTFTIKDGSIAPSDFLQDGQYYRIIGSVFNDGVHKFGTDTLTNEKPFDGAVWAMAVPPDFLEVVGEIEAYCKSDAGKTSPFVSESFGGYSYTKATTADGSPVGWKQAFASRLNKWRKL